LAEKAARVKQILDASELILVEQAHVAVTSTHIREVLDGLERAIAPHPTTPILWDAKGMLIERTNGFLEALAMYSKAIELAAASEGLEKGFYHDALSNRCRLLRRMARFPEAALDYEGSKACRSRTTNSADIPERSVPDYHWHRPSALNSESLILRSDWSRWTRRMDDRAHRSRCPRVSVIELHAPQCLCLYLLSYRSHL